MTNIIVFAIIACIICAAGWYVLKEKKSGRKCIGCPDSKTCGGCCGKCSQGCSHRG